MGANGDGRAMHTFKPKVVLTKSRSTKKPKWCTNCGKQFYGANACCGPECVAARLAKIKDQRNMSSARIFGRQCLK